MKYYKELTLDEIEDKVKRRNRFTNIETVVQETGSIFVDLRSDEYLWLIERVRELEEKQK